MIALPFSVESCTGLWHLVQDCGELYWTVALGTGLWHLVLYCGTCNERPRESCSGSWLLGLVPGHLLGLLLGLLLQPVLPGVPDGLWQLPAQCLRQEEC